MRATAIPTALLVAPLAVSAAAIAVLLGFPRSWLVWQLGAWTLVLAALLLAIALPATGYALLRNASARTWPRGIAFAMALLYAALLAYGALS